MGVFARRPGVCRRSAVNLTTDAPPDEVGVLISDSTKMGHYSSETVGSEWIDGAKGPSVAWSPRRRLSDRGLASTRRFPTGATQSAGRTPNR
jgi:hypothetical protein